MESKRLKLPIEAIVVVLIAALVIWGLSARISNKFNSPEPSATMIPQITEIPPIKVGAVDPNELLEPITAARVHVASASSTVIAASTSFDNYVVISNDSPFTIYLGFGDPASKGWGYPLRSNEKFTINHDNLFNTDIYGIASISNGTDYARVGVVKK